MGLLNKRRQLMCVWCVCRNPSLYSSCRMILWQSEWRLIDRKRRTYGGKSRRPSWVENKKKNALEHKLLRWRRDRKGSVFTRRLLDLTRTTMLAKAQRAGAGAAKGSRVEQMSSVRRAFCRRNSHIYNITYRRSGWLEIAYITNEMYTHREIY